MDVDLFTEAQEGIPSFNLELLEGLAYSSLKTAQQDVDRLIRCAEESYPEGFEYLGSTVCSPQKAFKVMSRSLARGDSKNSASVDLAPSDVQLVEYRFAFNGQPLHPRYFNLPAPRKGGFIRITGKNFSLATVLADPCFSVGLDYVFIRLNRAPVTFRQTILRLKVDGLEFSKPIAYSKLHHRGGNSDRKNESDSIHVGRVPTTLPHYLFARFGVVETFDKFCRADVILTTAAELKERPLDEKRFAILSSCQTQPSTSKFKGQYAAIATDVVIAVPREKMSPLVISLAAGFFYILDHYPQLSDPVELSDPWTWKVWLGYVLWGDQLGHNKLVENVESHLNSLDDYIDIEARRNLMEEEGVHVDDLYQLFVYILNNMDEMISAKEADIGSMYGKRLMTTPYVLRDIYEQIFRCLFEIINNRKRKHKTDDLNKILGKFFTPVKIFDLRNTNAKAYVSSVSSPGDNMFFKATSRLVMQAQTSAGAKSQNLNVNDPSSHLDASWIEAGNLLVLLKTCPLACNTVNPTVALDAKKTILRKESMRATVAHVHEAIRRD